MKNLQDHLKCMWRLIWLPVPNLSTRVDAVFEAIRLFKIYRKLRMPFGLQEELTSLIPTGLTDENAATSENLAGLGIRSEIAEWVEASIVEKYLLALKFALMVHPAAACLERSIRILQILQANGIYGDAVRFKIGIRRSSSGFRGHAWVEYCGQPLLNLPLLGSGYGDLGRPLLDAPNLLVHTREYDYVWDGNRLIEEAAEGTEEIGDYEIKEGLVVKQLGEEEAVLLDLTGGGCFGLDPIGYEMWKSLTCSRSLNESVHQLAQELDVDVAVIKMDVEELLRDLLEAELIREKI